MERKTHTIDANGRPLGRLATEIAIILRGKNKATFVPNKDEGDFVEVKNMEKVKVTGKKMENKIYYHHTGFPSGLRAKTMKEVFKKDPGEVLRKTVYGMLPKNKLRPKQMKRLKIIK